MHDRHRRRSRRGPHRAEAGQQSRLRAPISAQIQPTTHTNQQVNRPQSHPRSRREPSQGSAALKAELDHIEQGRPELKRLLGERDEELAAARETNRRLMNQLNRSGS
jgi:hypothetical protein